MGSRIIKQPNGKLARFSEVVDDFTHINMDVIEATRVCMEEGMSVEKANAVVGRGINDNSTLNGKTSGSGMERWNEALSIIKSNHGNLAVDRLMAEIKGVA
jgi:hypothetical protein